MSAGRWNRAGRRRTPRRAHRRVSEHWGGREGNDARIVLQVNDQFRCGMSAVRVGARVGPAGQTAHPVGSVRRSGLHRAVRHVRRSAPVDDERGRAPCIGQAAAEDGPARLTGPDARVSTVCMVIPSRPVTWYSWSRVDIYRHAVVRSVVDGPTGPRLYTRLRSFSGGRVAAHPEDDPDLLEAVGTRRTGRGLPRR